jgi:hypothetical protein
MKQLLQQSLRELAPIGPAFAAPTTDLVARCEALWDKPLQDFSIEDLRTVVGQQIGLPWVVPLALTQLTKNLFSEGGYYAGDLLTSVLRVESDYWQAHPAERNRFRAALSVQLPLASSYHLPRATLRAALQWLADFKEVR